MNRAAIFDQLQQFGQLLRIVAPQLFLLQHRPQDFAISNSLLRIEVDWELVKSSAYWRIQLHACQKRSECSPKPDHTEFGPIADVLFKAAMCFPKWAYRGTIYLCRTDCDPTKHGLRSRDPCS